MGNGNLNSWALMVCTSVSSEQNLTLPTCSEKWRLYCSASKASHLQFMAILKKLPCGVIHDLFCLFQYQTCLSWLVFKASTKLSLVRNLGSLTVVYSVLYIDTDTLLVVLDQFTSVYLFTSTLFKIRK